MYNNNYLGDPDKHPHTTDPSTDAKPWMISTIVISSLLGIFQNVHVKFIPKRHTGCILTARLKIKY